LHYSREQNAQLSAACSQQRSSNSYFVLSNVRAQLSERPRNMKVALQQHVDKDVLLKGLSSL